MLADEVSASSPDFGHLEPMVKATKRELQAIGVSETPVVAIADSGYWNEQQIDNVVANEHVQVLIPPDAGKRDTPRPGWRALRIDARCPRERLRRPTLPKTKGDGRAGVRTDQAQRPNRQLPTTTTIRRALRMAADHRHPLCRGPGYAEMGLGVLCWWGVWGVEVGIIRGSGGRRAWCRGAGSGRVCCVVVRFVDRVGTGLSPAPPTPPDMRVRIRRFAQHDRKRR